MGQIARIFEAKGWSTDDYDRLIDAMDLAGHSAEGVVFHVAGPTENGFRAIDVYESVEAADRLASELIVPLAMKLGLTPPEVAQFDVHRVLTPARG